MKFIFTDKVMFNSTDKTVNRPVRATDGSAGHDFFLPEETTIQPKQCVVVDSKITAKIPVGFVTTLHPRSSIGIKKHLMLANTTGVIDSDYTETIKIALYNYGNEPVTLEKGERVMQAITVPYIVSTDSAIVSKRNGGIGSTGRK